MRWPTPPRPPAPRPLTVTYEPEFIPSIGTGDDSYQLGGTPTALTIDAPSEAGAVRGLYDLAAAVRDGRSVTEHLGELVASALPFRMVDLGAVGVAVDEDAYSAGTDYSHNSLAFEDVILPDAPYIDEAALASARVEFEQYVAHVLAEGATAIAIPGFIEYLTFDELGVYDEGDDHVARALAMQQSFGPLWQYAHELGLKVYFRTDMLALTTPLEQYLTERFGSLDTENPEFWQVYSAGLDELYAAMPYVDGVLIRIGEAGPGLRPSGVGLLLGAERHDGARRARDAHRVHRAGRASRPRGHLPHLERRGGRRRRHAHERRVVPRGARRHRFAEPHRLDEVHARRLLQLPAVQRHPRDRRPAPHRRVAEPPRVRELRRVPERPGRPVQRRRCSASSPPTRTSRASGCGPKMADPGEPAPSSSNSRRASGSSPSSTPNSACVSPATREADPAEITADWARRWFSDDPATVTAIAEAMAESRAAITDGLYIGPYAERQVAAIGLHPPPMMWLFEWDILTGDSAVLDVIYQISRDDLDEAISAGPRAVAAVERMRGLIEATDAASWKSAELRTAFLDTLDYQQSTLEMLADYRAMILRQAEWHDTGATAAYDAWATAKDAFEQSAAAHEAAYAGDPYYPAYNLTAARLGVDRAERDLPMAWAARILLALVVLWLAFGAFANMARISRIPGARVARALWVSATRPWRAAEVVAGMSRLDRILLAAIPGTAIVLSELIATWFLAPAHLVVTLGAWLVFGAIVLGFARSARRAVIAAVGGAALLRVVLLLAALAPTGPGGYWFGFWTDEVARSLYVTVAFALFVWVLVAAGWALAGSLGGRRATGVVLTASGAVLVVMGVLIGAIGLESALTVWNDQLGLLPWGLSRILGITVYLEIPVDTPWFAAAFGAVLVVVGAVLRPGSAPARDGTGIFRQIEYSDRMATELRDSTFWILTVLSQGRRHGYALMQEARELSDGRVDLKVATLYAALDRLGRQRARRLRRRRSRRRQAAPLLPHHRRGPSRARRGADPDGVERPRRPRDRRAGRSR